MGQLLPAHKIPVQAPELHPEELSAQYQVGVCRSDLATRGRLLPNLFEVL